MKKKVITLVFKLICFTLFFFKLFMIYDEYSEEPTVTNTFKEKHQNIKFPHICITTSHYVDHNFNYSLNFTHDQYVFGTWRTEDMSEEELFEFLALQLHDLIHGISVRKTVNDIGDFYEKVSLDITKDSNLEDIGFKVIRKDYYKAKHIFCLELQ